MTFQCVENEYCKVEVHYIADPSKVEKKINEAVSMLKKAPIPGFRPGKAPDYVIKLKKKEQIERWVQSELVAEAYDEILFETKMKTVGYPQVRLSSLHGNQFNCELLILKKPDFELKEYKNLEVPKPHQAISPTDMAEKMVEQLRWQHASCVPYGDNDFVQLKDDITADIDCTVNGEPFEPATQHGTLYTVGNNFFPEFDDNILGMMAGEERSFDVKLDDKLFHFKVQVHMGLKKTPCPLDDTLAEKVGFESFDKLREQAQGLAISRAQEREKSELLQQVLKRLIAAHDFKVPDWLRDMEAQQLLMQHGGNFAELSDQDKQTLLKQAEDNVKVALILDSIRDKEPEAMFTDEELINVVKNKVSEMGQDPEKYILESQKTGKLLGMLAGLRNQATLDWLLSQTKIVE